MEIFINDIEKKLNLEMIEKFKEALVLAFDNELSDNDEFLSFDIDALNLEVCVSIVTAEEIQKLNANYRNIDRVTDVLSFPQFENKEDLKKEILNNLKNNTKEQNILVGDVVICYDKAVEQAENFGTGLKREILYLFVHSIFHLLGYDHMHVNDKAIMREKEEKVMGAFII